MGSIIESFASQLTPQVADRIASTAGVPPNLVAKGLGVIGPLVVGLAARSAVTPGGLRSVMNLLPPGHDVSSPGAVDDVLRASRDGHASSGLMTALFGAGQGSITRSLTRALGFDVTKLLRIGTMLMLGAIARKMRESREDDAATAKLLQEEQRTFLARGDVVSRTVQEALERRRRSQPDPPAVHASRVGQRAPGADRRGAGGDDGVAVRTHWSGG